MPSFKYKVKNIVDAIKDGEVDVIGQQANCFSVMKSGVAKALTDEWPEIAEADKDDPSTPEGRLGEFSTVYLRDCRVRVFNLYGQLYYGKTKRQTNYGALSEALYKMFDFVGMMLGENHIGFPKLGAGLAGGDWEVIEEMIKHIFRDHDVTIYVLNKNEVPHWYKGVIE